MAANSLSMTKTSCVILNLPTPPVRSEMSSWTAKQWNKKLNVSAYCKSNRIFSPVWNDQRLILSSSVSYLAREVNLATETIVYQARPSLTGRRLNSSVRRVGEKSWSSLTDYNNLLILLARDLNGQPQKHLQHSSRTMTVRRSPSY